MNHSDKPLIRLCDLNYSAGGRKILEDVNLTVFLGDFMAITGPNGGGKTTLLRLILRLLKPTGGVVEYFDSEGRPTNRLRIGYLPQKNMIDSRFPITVREVIASGLMAVKGLSNAEHEQRIDAVTELIELTSHSSQPIGELSGGQLQRTLLGRAIVSQPDVLVLDEPLSYLDKYFEQQTYKILEQLAPGRTVILVSHEMSRIATMANRHIIVDHRLHECHGTHHFVPCDCD